MGRFFQGQYRTNELVWRRMNFSSDAMADFEGLLEVNRKICQQQMAEKASSTLPTNCAVLPKIIHFQPVGISSVSLAADRSFCGRSLFLWCAYSAAKFAPSPPFCHSPTQQRPAAVKLAAPPSHLSIKKTAHRRLFYTPSSPTRRKVAAALSAAVTTTNLQEIAPNLQAEPFPQKQPLQTPAALREGARGRERQP